MEVISLDSLIDSYKEKIKTYESIKEILEPTSDKDLIVPMFLRMLDKEIADYQIRIERATPNRPTYPCVNCGRQEEKEHMKLLNDRNLFCQTCENTIKRDMVSSAFESKHGLPAGKIKQDATSLKDPLKVYKDAQLVRKSGGNWMIHDLVWELHYKNRVKNNKLREN
jgi:hypothetical protein